MLRTEQPTCYSRHKDYYELWMQKKKEVQKLENNLLDSKKIIRTLHLKLTDILQSIKVFETNQDLADTNEAKEASDVTYSSAVPANAIIASETVVKGHPCDFQENRTELVKQNHDQVILTENSGQPREIHPILVLSDSLLNLADLQKPAAYEETSTIRPVAAQKAVSRNEVKGEQCGASGNNSELFCNVISAQELNIVSITTPLEIQPDNINSKLTFEAEDDHQTNDEMEPNSTFDFQANTESSPSVMPSGCGMLSMNVFESFKSEPMEELISNQDTASFVVMANHVPTEHMEEIALQASAEDSASDKPIGCGILSMNVLERFKSEPTEELISNQDTANIVDMPNNEPIENIQEVVLQTSSGINILLLKCSQCHKEFRSMEDLDINPENRKLIPMCGSCQLKTRETNHHFPKDMKNTCEICGRTFTHPDFLASHKLRHTNITCALDNVLLKDQGLSCHKLSANRARLRRCEVSVERLVMDQYPTNKSSASSLKCHKCTICGRYFKTYYAWKNHYHISHPRQKSHKCKFCNKMCSNASNLEVHIRTHTGEKPFECKVCKKKFVTVSNRKDHEVTHSELKPHKCPICSKGFRRLRDMKNHLRVHTMEKSYECVICKKKYFQVEGLKYHLRTHTGEKPYQCNICSKAFSSSSTFYLHQRTRHES